MIRNMQIELVLMQMGLILVKFNELELSLKYLKKYYEFDKNIPIQILVMLQSHCIILH